MRRASRSSSIIGLALFLACIPSFGQVAGSSPATQAPSPLAVLRTAPEFRRGIDWLPANAIPHWAATYVLYDESSEGTEVVSGGTEVEIEVLVVDIYIDQARAWDAAPCRLVSLRGSGGGYYYENPEGWSVLVAPPSPEGQGSPPPCEFVDRFVSRYQYFRNSVTTPGSDGSVRRPPPFPAILSPER